MVIDGSANLALMERIVKRLLCTGLLRTTVVVRIDRSCIGTLTLLGCNEPCLLLLPLVKIRRCFYHLIV